MSDWRLESGIKRGQCLDLSTPEELAIRHTVDLVEELGAHVLLTDCVVLLGQAREKLSEWVDAGKPGASTRCRFGTPTGEYPEMGRCGLREGHEGPCSLKENV